MAAKELLFLIGFNVFILCLSFQDIKKKELSGVTLCLGFIFALIMAALFRPENNFIQKLLRPSAGLLTAFLVFDFLTHSVNVLLKREKTNQGLISLLICGFSGILLFIVCSICHFSRHSFLVSLPIYIVFISFFIAFTGIQLYSFLKKRQIIGAVFSYVIFCAGCVGTFVSCIYYGIPGDALRLFIISSAIVFLIQEVLLTTIFSLFPCKSKCDNETKKEESQNKRNSVLGGGDTVFMALLGSMLGPEVVFSVFFLGLLLFACMSMVLKILEKFQLKQVGETNEFPFVPFLAIAGEVFMILNIIDKRIFEF